MKLVLSDDLRYYGNPPDNNGSSEPRHVNHIAFDRKDREAAEMAELTALHGGTGATKAHGVTAVVRWFLRPFDWPPKAACPYVTAVGVMLTPTIEWPGQQPPFVLRFFVFSLCLRNLLPP